MIFVGILREEGRDLVLENSSKTTLLFLNRDTINTAEKLIGDSVIIKGYELTIAGIKYIFVRTVK